MTRPRGHRLALATISLLACMGCGARSPAGSPFGGPEQPDFVTIEVENLNFNQARLYTLRDGSKSSLGVVGGKETHSFRVPWRFDQEMRIEINLLAGSSCTTEALRVAPGEVLQLRIASEFNSSVCRRG